MVEGLSAEQRAAQDRHLAEQQRNEWERIASDQDPKRILELDALARKRDKTNDEVESDGVRNPDSVE